MFKFGKPSISMGHLYHGELLNNHFGVPPFLESPSLGACLADIADSRAGKERNGPIPEQFRRLRGFVTVPWPGDFSNHEWQWFSVFLGQKNIGRVIKNKHTIIILAHIYIYI